jgi:hypothetical protein
MKHKTLFFILMGAIIIWLVFGFGPIYFLANWNDRSAFGDMFGAVNSLFSGLAFVGVVIAVIFQSKELFLQREELTLTRTELQRTAKANEVSARELSNQVSTMRHSATLMAYSQLVNDCDRRIREIGQDSSVSVSSRDRIIQDERNQYLMNTRRLLNQLSSEE